MSTGSGNFGNDAVDNLARACTMDCAGREINPLQRKRNEKGKKRN